MQKIAFYLSFLISLSACSTANLQSSRLEQAEYYITQAEQLSTSDNNRQLAIEELGTAEAYLATLTDFRKHLNDQETAKLKTLKTRAKVLRRRLQ